MPNKEEKKKPVLAHQRELLIVCDTNVYVNDFSLRGKSWPFILGVLKTTKRAKLLLLESIEHELLYHFRKNAQAGIEAVRSASQALDEYGVKITVDQNALRDQVEQKAKDYRQFLTSASTGKIEFIAMPKMSTRDLFISASGHEAPFFSSENQSFKDAVIWKSLVDLIANRQDSDVAFVCGNPKDFSESTKSEESKSKLHPKLNEDVLEVKSEEQAFHYFCLPDKITKEFINIRTFHAA